MTRGTHLLCEWQRHTYVILSCKQSLAKLRLNKLRFTLEASKHPFFRGAFSYLFEKFFHVWFYSNPADELSLSCTTWSSCAESTAKPLCLNPVGWEKVIVQGELGTKGYRSANEHRIPFGWIPASRSDATVDAVICTHTQRLLQSR